MSWPEIISILEAQLSQLQKPGVLKSLKDWMENPSRDDMLNELRSSESTHQRILDIACEQFAEKRTLPDLNPEQIFWFYARLDSAHTLVKFFLIGKRSKGEIVPNSDIGMTDRKILEYVLVYYWHWIGLSQFLGLAVLGRSPFDPLADLPDVEDET